MKKFIVYLSLFAMCGFIGAAANKPTLYIVWNMGISGKVQIPGSDMPHSFPFVPDRATEKPVYPFCPAHSYLMPIEVWFCRTDVTDDARKKEHLQPPWWQTRIFCIHVPQKYGTWDNMPDGTAIILSYSVTTKVAATIKYPLKS